ncbi:MAG: hypothetical protein U0V72_12755 [Cytophagales bacterium]
MKKSVIVAILSLMVLASSCNMHHTCPAYIGSTSPHHAHIQHHPHH